MIVSTSQTNPFKVSRIEIGGLDLSDHFVSLGLEEGMFHNFVFGTLCLKRAFLDFPGDWDGKEQGFLGRQFVMEWTTDVIREKSSKKITMVVYGVSENGAENVTLLLVQEPALDFYTKQFCDAWESEKLSVIAEGVLTERAGIKKDSLFVQKSSNSVSYANPVTWSTSKAMRYLLPMMKSSDGHCGYVLFSSTRTDGKVYCQPFNDFVGKSNSERFTMFTKFPSDPKSISTTLSVILEYGFSPDGSNLLEQMTDGAFGSVISEYDPKTKAVSQKSINNTVDDTLKKNGPNNVTIATMNMRGRVNSFYFSGSHGEEIERSEALYEFLKKNTLIFSTYGLSSRNVGDTVSVDLYSEKNMLNDPRAERSGKNVITGITHMITPLVYYHKVSCVKPGLMEWIQRKPII